MEASIADLSWNSIMNMHRRQNHPVRNRHLLLSSLLLAGAAFSPASYAGQVEQGREIFNLCIGCHSITPNEHRFGPSLAGVFNRPAGRLKGFEFSDSLRDTKFKWDEAHLQQWLQDEAKNMVPGTRMEFPGIANPDEVKALIAYMKTLKAK